MLLWRISEPATLDGQGGLFSQGRWHSKGQPVVYTAAASALAILESLVRVGRIRLPAPYQLLRIEAPEELTIARWESDAVPASLDESREWGDAWLMAGATPLASVPSAVAPHSRNMLVNPVHGHAARIKIVGASRWPWDKRLFT